MSLDEPKIGDFDASRGTRGASSRLWDRTTMIATFDRNGIVFQYPTNWTLDFEDGDGGWTAIVQSNELAFVLVSLRADAEAPAMLADEALAALREEYKELDAETFVGAFQGLPAIGHDVNFLTVDTAIECRTRAMEAPAGPLLVMTQSSEYDREKNGIVLEAIMASFRFEDESSSRIERGGRS